MCVPFWRESREPPRESETAAVSLSTRMGCNLCSLQKREEHYKLLYEISQVRHATRHLPEIQKACAADLRVSHVSTVVSGLW